MRGAAVGVPAHMHRRCTGTGEPVVFLHGIPTSGHLWHRIVESMCSTFFCIAVDLPGLGSTPPLAQGFRRLPDLADALEGLRLELGVARWHLVGHDAGCAVAVEYTHQYPQRVARAAFLTPSIFPDLRPFALFEVLRTPLLGELLAPAVNQIFWKIVMRLALADDRHWTGEQLDVVRHFQQPFCGPSGAWRLMSLLRWGDPAEVLAAIPHHLTQFTTPALIVHGMQDRAVPAAFATRAACLIPDSELIFLNAGHFLPLTHASVIARELSRFFASNSSVAEQRKTSAVH